jgi:hypothetical protein
LKRFQHFYRAYGTSIHMERYGCTYEHT